MYKILKVVPTESNTELRLAEIDNGYSVGVWDLDCEEYYGLRIYGHELEMAYEKALNFFNQQANK